VFTDRLAGITHEIVFRWLRRFGPRRSVILSQDPLVSVVCVSNRPDQLGHILEQYSSQSGARTELILVTNAPNYAGPARSACETIDDATVIETDASVSLGSALNRGFAAASGEVIAKFDDDDWYSPTYVAEACEVMREHGSGVVGKKTYFVYFEAPDETMRLYSGNEDTRVGRLAGGTIVAHRDVCEQVSFADITLGEDVRFVRAAERRGFAIYGADARGYLQLRSTTHTWKIDDKKLAADGILIGSGRRREYWL